MNDYDADEIVTQRKGGAGMPVIDKALVASGIALAGLALVFPWYAFLNQDKFSMPALWQGTTRDLPEKIGSPDVAALTAGTPKPAAETLEAQTRAAVDRIVTATVPAPTPPAETEPASVALDQPFPSASTFKLVHVAGGRALIEDDSGMYIVRVGSALPDNSRLATLEERDGRWVLITSNGDVFKAD